MLRAVLFTGTAFGALRHGRGILFQGSDLCVLQYRAEFLIGGGLIVAAKGGRNVHAVGTGHTVSAAGAANFERLMDFLAQNVDQVMVCLGKGADPASSAEAIFSATICIEFMPESTQVT